MESSLCLMAELVSSLHWTLQSPMNLSLPIFEILQICLTYEMLTRRKLMLCWMWQLHATHQQSDDVMSAWMILRLPVQRCLPCSWFCATTSNLQTAACWTRKWQRKTCNPKMASNRRWDNTSFEGQGYQKLVINSFTLFQSLGGCQQEYSNLMSSSGECSIMTSYLASSSRGMFHLDELPDELSRRVFHHDY